MGIRHGKGGQHPTSVLIPSRAVPILSGSRCHPLPPTDTGISTHANPLGSECWHPDLKRGRGEADLLQEVPVRGGCGTCGLCLRVGGQRPASRHMEKPNSFSALKPSATCIEDITWIFLTPCSTTAHLHAELWLLPPGMGEACPASHNYQRWRQEDHCPHSQARGLSVV